MSLIEQDGEVFLGTVVETGLDSSRHSDDRITIRNTAPTADDGSSATVLISLTRRYCGPVAYRVIRPDALQWVTRPHESGDAARHVAELSELAEFAHTRANIWRYEPGARGLRHRHPFQEETFVVLRGTLSMYLGEPPERHDVPTGGLIHIDAGTPLQTANHGHEDLLVYVYGTPPESEPAEILASAVPA